MRNYTFRIIQTLVIITAFLLPLIFGFSWWWNMIPLTVFGVIYFASPFGFYFLRPPKLVVDDKGEAWVRICTDYADRFPNKLHTAILKKVGFFWFRVHKDEVQELRWGYRDLDNQKLRIKKTLKSYWDKVNKSEEWQEANMQLFDISKWDGILIENPDNLKAYKRKKNLKKLIGKED